MTKTPAKNHDKSALGDRTTQEELDAQAAGRPPAPGSKDRPGFDLGGAVTDATAGTGLGLGDDASENRLDRRLPGRRQRAKLGLPRFGGAVAPDTTGRSQSLGGSVRYGMGDGAHVDRENPVPTKPKPATRVRKVPPGMKADARGKKLVPVASRRHR